MLGGLKKGLGRGIKRGLTSAKRTDEGLSLRKGLLEAKGGED